MIDAAGWCRLYLAPVTLAGEALRFDLSAFRSRVTREMLQARLRMTAQAFGANDALVAANIAPDAATLEVDAAALMAANAAVESQLADGPAGALQALRRLSAAAAALEARARRCERAIATGRRPTAATLLAYLDASARDQALGALKFCLPADLKRGLAPWFDEAPELVEALLAPAQASLFSQLQAQELVLAAHRLRDPAPAYARRLQRFRRAWGFLQGEDVDFEAAESLDVIDARAAERGTGGPHAVAAQQRWLRDAQHRDRGRKLAARRVFAEWLAAGAGGERAARLVSHVLLARALAAHEDDNRRRKMRLLRDLRDVAHLAQMPLATSSLRELAVAGGAFAGGEALLASDPS